MAKKQKYYVVLVGKQPGIYTNWDTCKRMVDGYPNAVYKSFLTMAQAEAAYKSGYFAKEEKSSSYIKKIKTPAPTTGISVDAGCQGNPGPMDYKGVDIATKKELFIRGPFENGTNNIGEFLAIVHAMALIMRENINLPIYSDSRIAINWVKKGKCATKLKENISNAIIFDMIARAEKWLANNTDRPALYKWETEAWGEIPADFGRK
jgi:ribonuclease HI